MTYSARETSRHDGQPVELYEFTRAAEVWRYTSADADIVHAGQVWTAQPMTRSAVSASQEAARNTLTLTLPRDAGIAAAFLEQMLTAPMLVTVWRLHRGDTEAVPIWLGRVLDAEWQGAEVAMACEPVQRSLQRIGLRRLYSRACVHVLYGPACGLVLDTWAVAATVASGTGRTVESAAAGGQPNGYFSGGMLDWTDAQGRVQRRMIIAHVGTTLTLLTPAALPVGQAIRLVPGCDHTFATCGARFGNVLRYGGQPFMPCKNPFDTMVY